MKTRIILILCILLAFLATACASGAKSSKTAADAKGDLSAAGQSEKIDFVADTSPMPDPMEWIAKANEGNVDAQFVVSMMYRDEIGVSNILDGKASSEKVDMFREMLRWRHRAENAENEESALADLSHRPRLGNTDGEESTGEKKDSIAIPWLETAAAHGYPNAEFVLGLAYYNGIDVKADRAKGVELIRRAAVHGLPEAQYHLGMMYTLGIDMPADAKRGMQWLETAAEQDNHDAQFILAMMYRDGIGVTADAAKSETYRDKSEKFHLWSLVASPKQIGDYYFYCTPDYDVAELGDPHSDDCGGDGDYDEYAESLEGEELRQYEEAKWLHESQNKTLPYSVDYYLASQWLQKAALDEKNVYSRIVMSQIVESSGCREGDTAALAKALGTDDENLGEVLIAKAAAAGNPDAELGMATIDEGMALDEILSWLNKAAAHGNENALRILTEFFLNDNHIAWTKDGYEDHAKAWEYANRMKKDRKPAANLAYLIALCYTNGVPMCNEAEKTNGKPQWDKAREWYEKAIEDGDKDALFGLGEYYRQKNDKAKMREYYLKYIQSEEHTDYLPDAMAHAILRLTDPQKPDDAWYRFADSAFRGGSRLADDKDKDEIKAEKAILAYIEKLPAIDGLLEETERQIAFEKDKTEKELQGFFIYKEVIKPCQSSPWSCGDNLKRLHFESVKKALAGITAYVQAESGKLDLERIENAYYLMAIHYGKNLHIRDKWEDTSTVYSRIEDTSLWGIDSEMAFYTWYLRQIPYACAEMYKKLGKSEAWKDVLEKATKTVEDTPALQGGFGLDLLKDHLPSPY